MNPRLLPLTLFLLCLSPPLRADEPKEKQPESYQVPYRISDTRHLIVRARINGKGPFNLIVDTGAPALYITKQAGKKIGIEPDKNGWGDFDRFELEGGLVIPKTRARIEDIFQIEGMNGLGAAGVELHGLMGFNVLSRFKIEYDLTKEKMTWTPVDFKPVLPEKFGKAAPAGLEVMGSVMKVLGFLIGRKPGSDITLRGFLGVEIAESKDGIEVKSLLEKGPAEMAGLKMGDRITHLQERAVKTADDFRQMAGKFGPGESIKVKVLRSKESKEITVTTGKGL